MATIDEQITAYQHAYAAAMALWRYHSNYLARLVVCGIDVKGLEEYQKYLIVARDLHNINQHLDRLQGKRP